MVSYCAGRNNVEGSGNDVATEDFGCLARADCPDGLNATAGAQEKPRAIEAGKPKQTTERPFGGPPNRSPGALGKQCATEAATCPLEKPLKVGTECLCPGQNGEQIQGKTAK